MLYVISGTNLFFVQTVILLAHLPYQSIFPLWQFFDEWGRSRKLLLVIDVEIHGSRWVQSETTAVARLRRLRTDDPLKGHPRPIKQKLEL